MFLAMLLVVGLAAAPLSMVTAQSAAPPAIELVMTATPLATATAVEAPTQVEELPPIPTNPADWFNNPLALAAVVAFLVGFIKTNLIRDLTGLRTVVASLIVGAALSLLGTLELPGLGRWNDRAFVDAIVYGLQAAVIASGGWDVIKALIGLGKAPAPAA